MTVKRTVIAVGTGGVIAACVSFLPAWEGMDAVAKRDRIGTGHPITYCYGQTDEFGAVRVGQRFTKQECDEKLAESLPKYLAEIEPCIHVPLPDKTKAALLDAAYNAGPAAVCHSPMLAKMNAGNIRAGCNAFAGWYVRSDGVVRRGLVARRAGDGRKGEKQLCLEGLEEGTGSQVVWDPPSHYVGAVRHVIPSRPEGDFCSGSGQGPVDCPRDAKKAAAPTKHWWSWMFK